VRLSVANDTTTSGVHRGVGVQREAAARRDERCGSDVEWRWSSQSNAENLARAVFDLQVMNDRLYVVLPKKQQALDIA
jgi:hypothetical protein